MTHSLAGLEFPYLTGKSELSNMSTRLKSTIVSAFKMHGFALRSNAIDYAVEIFAPLESSKIEECLDRLIAQVIGDKTVSRQFHFYYCDFPSLYKRHKEYVLHTFF